MKKKFFILFLLVAFGVLLYTYKDMQAAGENCSNNCVTKQIGKFDAFDRFVPDEDRKLEIDESYWVQLRVKGRNSTTTVTNTPQPTSTPTTVASGGSDIMLILDNTGSMGDQMNKDRAGTTKVTRYQAAQRSLQRFVELSDSNPSDGTVDYMGFGSFKYCERYTAISGVPISWVYGGFSSDFNKNIGFGALHYPLDVLTDSKKTAFINTFNKMFRSDGGPAFCSESLSGAETDTGAGLTIANTQLTPILGDAPTYKNSAQGFPGFNNGPLAREYTQNKNIPKYVILASDGEENRPPKLYDQEIDRKARSIVATAKFYNVKVYTLAIDGQGEDPLLQRVAADTGGKFYTGRSEEELLASYQSIRNDINNQVPGTPAPQPTNTSSTSKTSATVEERINTGYFDIASLTTQTFKMRTGSGSNINCGADLSNCITRSTSGEIDIKTPQIGADEEVFVYFRVNPKQLTGSNQQIPVDQDTSRVRYSPSSYSEQVGNVLVEIINSARKPYFETQKGGDLYSLGGVKVELPEENMFFMRETYPGIVSHNTNKAIVSPKPEQISRTKWESKFYRQDTSNKNDFKYDTLLASVKNPKPINLTNQKPTDSGFYIHAGDLDITSSTFNSLNGKQYVIFVQGNLYLKSGVTIFQSGFSPNTSIAFIVKNNIGIDPAVKDNREVQGIYITDGVIDTACSGRFSGIVCSPNTPNYDDSALTLQGMFFAAKGYSLDRRGNPTIPTPGEKFVYRPELLLSAAGQLGRIQYSWQEIAP